MENTTRKEQTDLMEAARELSRLFKDFDPFSYDEEAHGVQRCFEDIDNDPGFVVMELIRMIRDFAE